MGTQNVMDSEDENGVSGMAARDPIIENHAAELRNTVARLLESRILDHRGDLTPEAQVQLELRVDKTRSKVLDDIVLSLAPAGIAPGVWLRWLRGEDSPLSSNGLKKPVPLKHGQDKQLMRGPASVKMYQERVAKAREELAQAEEELAYYEARDKSLIEWAVTDHLVRMIAPVFAMGPAWTVMRALSGYLSDEYADFQTRMLDGKAKERAIAELREEKQKESDALLAELDLWAGNEKFERAIRAAIADVVRDFEPEREAWVSTGRRPRSRAEIRESANPEAQTDRNEVLAGLKRSS